MFEVLLVLLGSGLAGEAVDDGGSRVGFDDVPHFGFAEGHAALLGQMVVGVDLDGEVIVGIDDFEEKGEVGAEVVEVLSGAVRRSTQNDEYKASSNADR